MPHNLLQKYVIIDYTKEMLIFAIVERQGVEEIVGMGQYIIDADRHMAEASFLVGDTWSEPGHRHRADRIPHRTRETRRAFGFFSHRARGKHSHAPPLRKNEFSNGKTDLGQCVRSHHGILQKGPVSVFSGLLFAKKFCSLKRGCRLTRATTISKPVEQKKVEGRSL